jgi:TPR repeat protein
VMWHVAAAEAGVARSQLRLGEFHERGRDVPEDPAEAARWYRAAAEQGLAEAGTKLGMLYFKGLGVERDLEEAWIWFQRAAESGDYLAKAWRTRVEGQLSPEQLATARVRAGG